MGRCPHNKAGGKKKKYSHKSARRTEFLKKGDDMIFDELTKRQDAGAECGSSSGAPEAESAATRAAAGLSSSGTGREEAAGNVAGKGTEGSGLPLDEDLPGMGQFYCLHCDRFFESDKTKLEHGKTKAHKKKVKALKSAPHTQLDADLAGGLGRPDNGPSLKLHMDTL